MVIAMEDGSTKKFSDIIELHNLYYSTILDCQAEICSIYVKRISPKEIAVYGDYKVLVFIRKSYVNEENSYSAITVEKNICEIVPAEAVEGVETSAKLELQPSCKFKQEREDSTHLYWRVEVLGEVKVTGKEAETRTKNPFGKSQSLSRDEDVLQFDGNDDISIEQLMDMDFELLKNIEDIEE